jgi:hypothetical protein
LEVNLVITTRDLWLGAIVSATWFVIDRLGYPLAAAYVAGLGTACVYFFGGAGDDEDDDGDDGGDDGDDGPHPEPPDDEEVTKALQFWESDIKTREVVQ